MKTAIYIEDGVVQLVITPENDFEKNALGSFSKGNIDATIMIGTFYDCQGGWTRHKHEENSLIIRYQEPKELPNG
ncbi:MAG: hypothetical protein CTY33_00120 [Methylotenera sp.]|nr:MAG: hypothetical protein CTY33_00120 [Methylotenera sp.]